MIPILSSIIFASHKRPSHQTRLKDFFLSLSYVGGVSFTYTLIGIFAGLSGNLITSSIQSPLLMIILGIVFILLALSMFDLYALKLPHFVENFIATSILRVEGGRYLNVFIIGMISSLVLSPCRSNHLYQSITRFYLRWLSFIYTVYWHEHTASSHWYFF